MEPTILSTIHQFIIASQRFEERRAGSQLTIKLEMEAPSRYSDEKIPEVTLTVGFYDGKHYQTITAASLEEAMTEAGRRAGFTDRQAMKIDNLQAELQALSAPESAYEQEQKLQKLM